MTIEYEPHPGERPVTEHVERPELRAWQRQHPDAVIRHTVPDDPA
jgi:hypothetical protein